MDLCAAWLPEAQCPIVTSVARLLQRHLIHPARAPRITTHDALHAQPATMPSAMALDGFFGVTRTGGIKATLLAEERAEQQFVAVYEDDENTLHGTRVTYRAQHQPFVKLAASDKLLI